MNYSVVRLLKKSRILSTLGYRYVENKTKKAILKYNNESINPNKILFSTTGGRFFDSGRSICEFLHQTDSSLDFVWTIKNSEFLSDFPDYVRTVQIGTDEFYHELSTACVWVYNYLIPQGTVKRDGQLYIQTWHGDKPFKRIANDAAATNKNYAKNHSGRRFMENELCDYFLNGSMTFIPIWKRSVGYDGEILSSGLPRNDVLVNQPMEKIRQIKVDVLNNEDCKVLIYAPTFRDHNLTNGEIGSDIDINRVLDILEKKYDCRWKCLMRAHGGSGINYKGLNEDKRLVDVTTYKDMADLLLISDMLITDYSSCAGDFALTGRAVLLYQDDYESYTTKDRALLFDMNETPYFVAHNMNELESIILQLNPENIQENDMAILKFHECCDTGHATEDISEIIINHITKQRNKHINR